MVLQHVDEVRKSLNIVDKYGVASLAIINSSHCGCLASSVLPKKGCEYLVLLMQIH